MYKHDLCIYDCFGIADITFVFSFLLKEKVGFQKPVTSDRPAPNFRSGFQAFHDVNPQSSHNPKRDLLLPGAHQHNIMTPGGSGLYPATMFAPPMLSPPRQGKKLVKRFARLHG